MKTGYPEVPFGAPSGTKFRSDNFKYVSEMAYLTFTRKTNKIIGVLRLSKNAPFNFYGYIPAKLKKTRCRPPLGLPFVTLLDPSGSPIETSPPKNRDLLGLNYLGLQNSTPPSLKSASAGIVKRT